jgi:TonB family protein
MSTAVAIETWKGQVIDGKFPLLERLGGSARSDVFLTKLPGQTAQKAAIKLILADERDSERTISRWEAIAKLSHPHLARIFHVGRCELNSAALLYVVMEYAEEDLSQVLPSRPLTPAETGDLLRGLVDVLAFLHEKSFVHARLKPSNVMAVDDHLKISSDTLQRSGERCDDSAELGPYDAPELGSGELSPAADIWSLGITLVAALSQKPPAWDRSTKGEPVLVESIPEPFREIARQCLRLDPSRRYTLENIKARLQPAAVSVRRKSRTGALIAAQVALIALLAGLWLVGHRGSAKAPPMSAKQENHVSASAPQPSAPAPHAQTGIIQGAVAERVLPNVSQGARDTIQGKIRVTVAVDVDSAGEVSEATLERPGPSKYFARLALASARAWKFQPAQVDGKPIPSKWTIRFRFGRAGTEAIPSETSP